MWTLGHLKFKNGLGFNTISMTIYICDVTVQYIQMVITASLLCNSSILCTYATVFYVCHGTTKEYTISLARCLFLCVISQ